MRKKRRLLVILLSFLIMFSGIYYYLTATSIFEIRASSRVVKTQIEEQGAIYFGYQFYFEGYGNPTIENVICCTGGRNDKPIE